jgi:hypothetical protein
VQQNIGEMVAAGFESVELTIDHVRDDRERMPIARLRVNESPRQSIQA